MHFLNNTPGRTCRIDGKEFLFFSGYSYLGMNHVKEFTEHVKKGVDKYGVLFPSSRISNTRLGLYEEFESELSSMTGMEETVSFSSGFLAGKTIAEILSSYKNTLPTGRQVFIASSSHPAITIETKNKNNAENFDDWKNEIVSIINSSNENEFVLIADSVNIFQIQINDFSFVKDIKEDKKIIFLIDDSHGIGIIGNAAGIAPQLPKKSNIEYIICYSLSKAFNINGGAVSCSKSWAEEIRQHPNYAGSTAINPSLMHAFLKSKKLYRQQREKLFKNILYLKKNLPHSLLKNKFDLPVFICSDENAEENFYKKNIIISSFSYPFPDSKKINRVVLNALHTKKDLERLSKVL